MQVQQLRYFCAVARTGSFTKAAEEEGVAQPSLSQQIAKLERDLEAPLFERLGRSVRLTEYGKALLPRAQEILREMHDARAVVEAVRSRVCGRLTVGCIPTITPYFLAPRIAKFAEQYPEIQLRLVEDVTPRLVEQLQDGEMDLAVAALPVNNPDLVCSELFREPILVGVGRDHWLAGRGRVDLPALRNERLLLLKEGHCFRDNALVLCNRARAGFVPVFETDQFSSILSLVASGYGISFVPAMAAAETPGCEFLPLEKEALRRIGYVRARRHIASVAQKEFVKWLRAESKAAV